MDTFASFIMLGLTIIIVIVSYLIERKLKKKIALLEKQLKDSNEMLRKSKMKVAANLDEIRLLKWQISNPPKYKRGDKFGDLTVKYFCVHKPSLSDFIAKAVMGLISICAGVQRENKKLTDLDMYWEYHLSHEHHGDDIKMSESSLTNIKSAENK